MQTLDMHIFLRSILKSALVVDTDCVYILYDFA